MGGRRKKRELRRIYRHRDSMHWLKPTFLPELFELGYILLRKCISPRHQSLMAPSGLSAYPTPKFVGCVFIPRCAPLEKSVDTRERCLSPLPTRVEWTRRILPACEGLVCDVLSRIHDWFDYNNEWREARWGIGWPVCHPVNNRAGVVYDFPR